MKRLLIGVALPLVASTWFFASQEHIASRPYSAVQRAYGVFTETMDRLPAKAATLRLWLPITMRPIEEENKPISTPRSSCPFQAARKPPPGDLGIAMNERKLEATSFVAELNPRFQSGRRLKPPAPPSARPILARTLGKAELDAFLHCDLISAFPLDSNLWERNFIEKRPSICTRTQDL